MSNLTLYGVDPGKNTGIAWLTPSGHFESIELGHFEALDWLVANLVPHTDTVYCEDFIITARTAKLTHQPWSLKAIGVLEWHCRRKQIPFFLNTASKAKKFSTDDKLRKLGWHRPTKDGHANDAARHLLLGAVDMQCIDLRRLVNTDG